MKNLNLNNYGVLEMNTFEMIETQGGGFWAKALKVVNDFCNGLLDAL